MNTGVVTISFTETVDISTFDVSTLTLAGTEQSFTLTNGTFQLAAPSDDVDFSAVVVMTLTSNDLNVIKSRDICNMTARCSLSVTTDTVTDKSSNALNPNQGGLNRLSRYVADITNPEIVQFSSLDFNSGQIIISFSEAVDPDAFDGMLITLQDFF
jgi:hypothetical protein